MAQDEERQTELVEVNREAAGETQEQILEAVELASKPIDSEEAPDALMSVLHNIDTFDWQRFSRWRDAQSRELQAITKLRPPNRLYDLDGRMVYVVGYSRGGGIAVREVGDKAGRGFSVDVLDLRDVTEDVKAQYRH